MKHIKIMEVKYDLKTAYRNAHELSERALLGYMIKAGLTNDVLYGAAFDVLHRVNRVNRCSELYKLMPYCDSRENEKKILYIVELALGHEFDDLALSRSEIEKDFEAYFGILIGVIINV